MTAPSPSGLRVALVYPPFDDKRDRSAYYVAPPLGLLYLAAYLRADGHDVRVHDQIFELKSGRLAADATLYTTSAQRILDDDPDIVAFSTQCTTSPGTVNIARRLKEANPTIAVLLGGHDVSFIAASYLDAFPWIDFVLGGEAELSIQQFARAWRGERPLDEVHGLTYRDATGRARTNGESERIAQLDALLPPAYDLVAPLHDYFRLSRRPTILVDSGRGCAFACEFCQTTLLSGSGIRYRSVASLVAELRDYQRLYGSFEAYFVHDLFTARRSFVEELCERLIDEDLGISWQCRCRLDQVDDALLKLMAHAGCRMLLYGIESGSERTLSLVNKRLRAGVRAQTVARVQQTVDAGIFPSLSMVVGFPEESLTDLEATMALAAAFARIGRVNSFIQLMSPLPGTGLAKRLQSRFEYRGDAAPTAFSQGIEFLNGRRLPEDEALVAGWPSIFQSFQTVAPDHGDLDLCIDVSLAYCKLLEVYCHTFGRLVTLTGATHLELFQTFRADLLAARQRPNLAGVKDFEIWQVFERFVAARAEIDADHLLAEIFRYECLVQELSTNPPLQAATDTRHAGADEAFRLHEGARVFRTDVAMPWLGAHDHDAADGTAILMYMTADRLHSIVLDPILAEALDVLDQVSALDDVDRALYARLFHLLEPLDRLGVLLKINEADSAISHEVAQVQ